MAEPDLLIEAGFSDAKLAAELRKIQDQFRKAGKDAEKAFKDATGGVADSQALRAHMREFTKLQQAYDPAARAAAKYEGVVRKLDQALKVGAISQDRYAAGVKQAQQEMAQTAGLLQTAERGTRNFAHSAQNVGYQVQDFAVQVSSGTDATRAFAQQFPQLASAFGPVGVGIGTLAAILIPLGAAFLGTGEKAQTLEDQLEALEKTSNAMTAAAQAAATPIEELRSRYGELADEVQRANQAMAQITAETARRDAQAAALRLGGELGDLPNLNAYILPGGGIRPGYEKAYAQGLSQAVAKLNKELGAGEDEAKALMAAINQLGRGTGPDDLLKEVTALQAALAAITPTTNQQQRALQAMADQAQSIADAATAITEAGADAQIAAQDEVIANYDKNTTTLKKLAADRQTVEDAYNAAMAEGHAERAEAARQALIAIDAEVAKVKASIAEMDEAFEFSFARLRRLAGGVLGRIGDTIREGDTAAANKGILELIKRRESGGDYNATLDNGRWTGGARDLVNMTIDEVLALQKSMLTPENIRKYGGKGSSALGAYQIVGTTLGGLKESLGLTGSELYSQQMQDRLAMELLRQRRGQGLKGLRQEWQGLVGVDDATIQAALGQQSIERTDPEVAKRNKKALEDEVRERKRKTEEAKRYGEQLAKNLLTERETAKLEAERNAKVFAIQASDMTDADKASAIAAVNAEMQRQITIMALMEEAKRRGVDLDAQMIGSAMTYREAILALGDAQRDRSIAEQQAAASAKSLEQAQEFAAQQTQALKDGLVNAIIEGENFADVMANVAKAMAKAALQAALFGEGPMASGGGGFLSGLFGGGGFLSSLFKGFGGARALGGPVSAGTPYLVGERGPEIIVPQSAGTVIPNNRLGSNIVKLTVDVRGATGNREVRQMVAEGVAQGMSQVRREVPDIVSEHQKRTG